MVRKQEKRALFSWNRRKSSSRAAVTFFTVWGIAIMGGVCVVYYCCWLSTSTTATMNNEIKNNNDDKIYSVNHNNHKKVVEPTTARENQAWMVRKFQITNNNNNNNQLPSESRGSDLQKASSQAKKQKELSGSTNNSFHLPHWLGAAGASKNAQPELLVDQQQYISDECKRFNHTVLRPTSGCEVNKDTQEVYCVFSNLRIDNALIRMARGGEPLEKVMGRSEALELPVYQRGAFSTRLKPNIQVPTQYRVGLHYLEGVLNNMHYPTKKNKGEFDSKCVETRNGTTLIMTRYDYANLYHTLTDWWNAFFVLTQSQKDRKETVQVLFLDGHAQGNLDSVWRNVIGPYEYVQHLPSGGVCFERAVFIPPGYLATISPETARGRKSCPLRQLAEEFSSHVLKSHGLENVKPIPGKVLIIDRQPYAGHPRSHRGKLGRVLLNLQELEQLLLTIPLVTSVEVVRFESMSFANQIRAVRQAQILIGNHGAGLSHLLFMDRSSSEVLEFVTDYRNFFMYLSMWKDISHTPIPVIDETRLSAPELERTRSVVDSILSRRKQYAAS